MRETRVRSLGWKDPLEKEMVNHSSILAWRIPWTEKPGRLQSTRSQRVGHDWATSPSPSSSFKRHWSILDRKRNWLWYAPVLAQIHSDRSSEKLPVSMHPSHSSRCGWLQPQVLATQYQSGLKQVTWFFPTWPQRHDIRLLRIKSVLMGDAFRTSMSKLTCSWCLLTCVQIILLWKGNV